MRFVLRVLVRRVAVVLMAVLLLSAMLAAVRMTGMMLAVMGTFSMLVLCFAAVRSLMVMMLLATRVVR